ncbi:hypothetical protein COCVIDRAFT_85213 [Bipolaris victoriae FI3]|uniref:Uncharacterized protein n=2 Tax=Bipolaris TaxID=33194 RepID=W6YSV0_COCC2|nr:uncharacterized protein COCCADRAFT_82872 [Bipolaris zeicola 26-R-13]XP_014561894.1 hypothetical protein COCVIDRAFT_85213 [Bipolaris victoriae FI3]EUC38504.1 hypothetical protein COCCADRAFT_82872 [Bipolaris zeicola 26-R-13]
MVARPQTGSLLKSPDVTRAPQLSPERQPSQASQERHCYLLVWHAASSLCLCLCLALALRSPFSSPRFPPKIPSYLNRARL